MQAHDLADESHEQCPFHDPRQQRCRVSDHDRTVLWTRNRHRCTSEDHDFCATFMARLLRFSQTLPGSLPTLLHDK